MRGYLPAALLAVLGLSCGSSSGEEVATDVVAFQPYSGAEWAGVLAIRVGGETVDYRSNAGPVTLPGLNLQSLLLPVVETVDGRLLLLDGAGNAPLAVSSTRAVPSNIARCFHGYLCQTSSGDVVDPESFGMVPLRDYPAVRGASHCDGSFCIVAGRALARDGAVVVPGGVVDIVAVSWADIGGGVYRGGYAFLRSDGSVATAGYDSEKDYVREVVGLPPIRRIHRGGVYEDYSGHMWYVGMAPDEWTDTVIPSDVPRRQCDVFVGLKLSLKSVSCVGPAILPALEGTKPQLDYGKDFIPVLYALDKAGTLRCWSAPGGPACVKGE